jgi:hypothetical protein
MPEGVGDRNLSGGRRARWRRRPAAGALAGGGSRRSGRASAGESSGRGARPQGSPAAGARICSRVRRPTVSTCGQRGSAHGKSCAGWGDSIMRPRGPGSDDDIALPFLGVRWRMRSVARPMARLILLLLLSRNFPSAQSLPTVYFPSFFVHSSVYHV